MTQNGDTANKFGTLSLATNAKRYGIPFLVAAPSTSIDLTLHTGLEIPIEERRCVLRLADCNVRKKEYEFYLGMWGYFLQR